MSGSTDSTERRCPACSEPVRSQRFCPECGIEHGLAKAVARDAFIGALIADRYEIVELIGSGGMGRVYRGQQRLLDRPVAIKLILSALSDKNVFMQRFAREAQTASRLNHPNVIAVYDFGWGAIKGQDYPFLVMEYVQGQSLDKLLAEGNLEMKRIVEIVSQVLGGLGEAHDQGITHRDVKPENVIIQARRDGSDHVKVIDFGLADQGDVARISREGELVGTPQYLSPEQIRGERVTFAADLYAVGVVLFELLVGRPPFDGAVVDVLAAHANSPRPDPRVAAPERNIPAPLAEVCMKAMSVAPADRFPSALAFAQALATSVGARGWTSHDASLFPSKVKTPKPTRDRAIEAFGNAPTQQLQAAAPDSKAIRTQTVVGLAPQAPPPSSREPKRTMHGVAPPAAPSRAPAAAAPPSSPEVPPEVLDELRDYLSNRSERPPAVAPPAKQAEPKISEPPPSTARARRPSKNNLGAITLERIRSMPDDGRMPLVGRSDDLAWASSVLNDPSRRAVAIWGRPGTGKTRLLDELASDPALHLLTCRAAPSPYGIKGYSGLRDLLVLLTSTDQVDEFVVRTGIASDAVAQTGARTVLMGAEPPEVATVETVRRAAVAVLRSAISAWVAKHQDKRCVLAIDDVDIMDGASLLALADLLHEEEGISGFSLLTTSADPPDPSLKDRFQLRELRGLSRSDVLPLCSEPVEKRALEGGEDEVLPLELELVRRLARIDESVLPSRRASLPELCVHAARSLSPAQMRTLQAIAVVGSAPYRVLMWIVTRVEDLDEALVPLVELGLVETRNGGIAITHPVLARVVRELTPTGSLADIHVRAAQVYDECRNEDDLRIFHELRGQPNLETYESAVVLASRAASRGDEDGAILTLIAASESAQIQIRRGRSAQVLTGRIACGLELARLYLARGSLGEARATLEAVVDMPARWNVQRAVILEQLSIVARAQGRESDAQKLRDEATAIAKRHGASELVSRLAFPREPTTSTVRRRAFSSSGLDLRTAGGKSS